MVLALGVESHLDSTSCCHCNCIVADHHRRSWAMNDFFEVVKKGLEAIVNVAS